MEGGLSSPVTQKMKLHALNMVSGYIMTHKHLSADGIVDTILGDTLHDTFTA